MNVAPDTFTVRDGVISSTAFPRASCGPRSSNENFVLEMEWRHLNRRECGFVRMGAGVTAPGTPLRGESR